jgi:glucose-1-phosphate cytidylyltransferase
MAWEHQGFWQPMDTPGERAALEERWNRGDAPWKVWPDVDDTAGS